MTGTRTAARLLLVGLAASVSCSRSEPAASQSGTPAATTNQPPTIEVTRVTAQTLNSTISLPGELTPFESVDLYAKETGFVKSIRVDRGSRVRRGEVLAELEAPELIARRAQASAAYQSAQSQLASAQAKLAADRATFERLREAAKTPGVVAGNDLEVAQKTAEADEANVAAAQKTAQAAQEGARAVAQLEAYLTITAPFGGQVTTRYVHPGALVGPSAGGGATTPIVRMQNLTRDRLVVPVPESNVAGVPDGTMVKFTVSAFPGRTFQAPIARISREVDEKTRTMPVELDVQDQKGELSPGLFCDVQWPVRRTYPTLFVPASSVASNLQRTFVVRVRDNRAEWVDVKTGARVGSTIEVFGDVHDSDVVAVRGSDQIRPSTEVRVTEAKPPDPIHNSAQIIRSFIEEHEFDSLGEGVEKKEHQRLSPKLPSYSWWEPCSTRHEPIFQCGSGWFTSSLLVGARHQSMRARVRRRASDARAPAAMSRSAALRRLTIRRAWGIKP